jgi:hypothetical protein
VFIGPQRLPVVLSKSEVRTLLSHLSGTPHLIASLLYGAGLRLRQIVEQAFIVATELAQTPQPTEKGHPHQSASSWRLPAESQIRGQKPEEHPSRRGKIRQSKRCS